MRCVPLEYLGTAQPTFGLFTTSAQMITIRPKGCTTPEKLPNATRSTGLQQAMTQLKPKDPTTPTTQTAWSMWAEEEVS